MASYFYQEPHFLEACSLCQRSLGLNSDIFMYRGNTPFCSKECREEQIEMDEARAIKSLKISSSRSIRKASESNESSSSNASESVRSSTLVVA